MLRVNTLSVIMLYGVLLSVDMLVVMYPFLVLLRWSCVLNLQLTNWPNSSC